MAPVCMPGFEIGPCGRHRGEDTVQKGKYHMTSDVLRQGKKLACNYVWRKSGECSRNIFFFLRESKKRKKEAEADEEQTYASYLQNTLVQSLFSQPVLKAKP